VAATRVIVRRDGSTVAVEVSDDGRSVTVDGRPVPVRVVADSGTRVELEVAGTPTVVGGWPAACREPPGPVDVNGESWSVEVEPIGSDAGPAVRAAPKPPAPSPARAAVAGEAVVMPPMPGRIVEVRVQDGERVAPGAVLLVLEAMKMRNEVTAPIGGVVRDLAVREGSNVRAREAMLRIAPG
jgi:biotin carboxyl carrier protein